MSQPRVYTEEEKKKILLNLKEQRDNSILLHKPSLIRLIKHLGTRLETEQCDHTFRFTEEWLQDNPNSDIRDDILQNFRENGMECDCQVLYKSYDKFI